MVDPIPTCELERRWNAVRQAMNKKGLDTLICVNTNTYLGGYVRWFTGLPTRDDGYNTTVIFPIEGEMTYVAHGWTPTKGSLRGVKDVLVTAQLPTLKTTYAQDAIKVVEYLKQKRPNAIGIVGLGTMPAAFYEYLVRHFPKVAVDDSTDLVDEIKAVKSEIELKYVRMAAEMSDMGMEVCKKAVRPGRKVYEVMADVQHALLLTGSEAQFLLGMAQPPGVPCRLDFRCFWNRTLREGDQFVILIEAAGRGGYYLECARYFCIGKIPKELEAGFDLAKEAQKRVSSMYIPGGDPVEILAANNQFFEEKGYQGETRLLGHGQGLDLVERPALTPYGETMRLMAGMVLSAHPAVSTATAFSIVADDFLVTETGGRRIQECPQEIFCV